METERKNIEEAEGCLAPQAFHFMESFTITEWLRWGGTSDDHRIIEESSLEVSFKGHLVQPLAVTRDIIN